MDFSRQEYWNGLPFPPPGDLPDPGTESVSPKFPALTGRLLTTSTMIFNAQGEGGQVPADGQKWDEQESGEPESLGWHALYLGESQPGADRFNNLGLLQLYWGLGMRLNSKAEPMVHDEIGNLMWTPLCLSFLTCKMGSMTFLIRKVKQEDTRRLPSTVSGPISPQ